MTDPDPATTAALERIRDIVHVTLDPQQFGRLAHVIAQACAEYRQQWARDLSVLHTPTTDGFWCRECKFEWPCRTHLVLADLLDGA